MTVRHCLPPPHTAVYDYPGPLAGDHASDTLTAIVWTLHVCRHTILRRSLPAAVSPGWPSHSLTRHGSLQD